jgi:hypothetical protein
VQGGTKIYLNRVHEDPKLDYDIVTCISDYRRGLNWMSVFINTLYNQLVQAIQLIADLYNLQFTVTHALGFSVLTSRGILELQQPHCD